MGVKISMDDKRVYLALLIMVILMLTLWNKSLTQITDRAPGKYLNMYKRTEESINTVVHTDAGCPFEWLVDGLDPTFYESKHLGMKQDAVKLGLSSEHDSLYVPKPVIRNPKYVMDPNRYLLPVLEGGPNNQVFCLRETILMAIKLNRTLVVPRFYKHFTDSQNVGTTFVYPGHRVNLKTICNLITCISLEDFRKTCGEELDAVMTFRSTIETQTLEYHSGMRLKKDDSIPQKVKVLRRTIPGARIGKVFTGDIWETFHSKDRCIVYQRPLFNIVLAAQTTNGHTVKRATMSAIDGYPKQYNSSDILQMIDITRKTQAPDYIGVLASNFIKFIAGKRPFVTVHWRYNKGDFERRCNVVLRKQSKQGLKAKRQYCLKMANFTAADAANAIMHNATVQSPATQKKATKIRDVYVASPPSEREFVFKVANILWKKKRWRVHTSAKLEKFILDKYSCDVTKRHLNDIVSTLEMEICARGMVFLKSSTSTWSANVALSRKFNKRQGTLPEMDSFFA